MIVQIAFWLFLVCIAAQCGYALFFFCRILFLKNDTVETGTVPANMVSVIICAKNEAVDLKQNLPSILTQRYMNEAGKPLYEVVVVNDASTDETGTILEAFCGRYENLRIVTITEDMARTAPGKKFALGQGITAAKHEWLLLTDADCMPSSSEWVRLMVQPLHDGKQIVPGYGGFYHEKGLLNAFIRSETVHTFLQYSTYAMAGTPYMAVGRNLAYTKEVYEKAQQAAQWYKVPSGDDDLTISIAGDKQNMAVVCDKSAFTYSSTKTSVKEWVQQKQRHFSTGKYYKPKLIILLGLYAATHAAMWLLFFVLLFTSNPLCVIPVMLLRCMIFWGLLAITAIKLKERNLIKFIPCFDLAWMVYNFAFAPYIIWKNKQQWK